jgi:hypothetical protein
MNKTPLQSLDEALKKSDPDSGIRLTAPAEIKIWSAEIGDASKHLTAIIDNWSLVTIKDLGIERIHLVGDLVGTTKIRTTRPILRIDLQAGFVMTLSESVYQLGRPHEGELGMNHVLAIGKAITNWRASQGRKPLETLQ